MTQRTESQPKTAIEKATEGIIQALNQSITFAHQEYRVPIPEKQFRRLLAGYIFNLSWPDCCAALRIEPRPEDAHLLANLQQPQQGTRK